MLEVAEVTAGYRPRVDVLREVSLTVAEGEFVAILGANGAGKTSLARCISGVVKLRSGRIAWRGTVLPPDPERVARKGVVHVPEGRGIFGDLTVLENLRLGAYWIRDDAEIRRQLTSVYEVFPVLRDRLRQPAATLSGGQQQMLALARGIMASPDLLIVDEPSLGLAPKLVDEVMEKLRDLNAGGLTVMLIEQSSVALSYCQRAYVLRSGCVVAEGDASALTTGDVLRDSYLS